MYEKLTLLICCRLQWICYLFFLAAACVDESFDKVLRRVCEKFSHILLIITSRRRIYSLLHTVFITAFMCISCKFGLLTHVTLQCKQVLSTFSGRVGWALLRVLHCSYFVVCLLCVCVCVCVCACLCDVGQDQQQYCNNRQTVHALNASDQTQTLLGDMTQ